MTNNYAAMPFLRGGFSAPPNMGFAFGQGPANLNSSANLRQLPVDELELRHLRSPDDFNAVRALRGHIDLAVHLTVDPRFHEHEKKEMK